MIMNTSLTGKAPVRVGTLLDIKTQKMKQHPIPWRTHI